MSALVTGATGCLGGHLVRMLTREGFSVTATGRNRNIGKELENSRVRFAPVDLTDRSAVDNLVAGHRFVFHCAALSTIWGRDFDFEQANVAATQNVVDACLQHKVQRLVHVSTPSVYFDFKDRLQIRESDPLTSRPANTYVATKLHAERLVKEAIARGLDAVILRPRGIFGPRDSALLPRLLRLARKGWLPLIGNGRAMVDITYVENVATAMILSASARADVKGQIYNISNGEPHDLLTLFQMIRTAFRLKVHLVPVPYALAYAFAWTIEVCALTLPLKSEPPLTRYSVGILGRSQTLCIDAARHDLNYAPKISVAEGLSRSAAWWSQHDAT